jgi:hypothetical protein
MAPVHISSEIEKELVAVSVPHPATVAVLKTV